MWNLNSTAVRCNLGASTRKHLGGMAPLASYDSHSSKLDWNYGPDMHEK